MEIIVAVSFFNNMCSNYSPWKLEFGNINLQQLFIPVHDKMIISPLVVSGNPIDASTSRPRNKEKRAMDLHCVTNETGSKAVVWHYILDNTGIRARKNLDPTNPKGYTYH